MHSLKAKQNNEVGFVSETKNALESLKGKGVLAILSGTFLTKVAAFLGSIILIRIMTKNEYGALSYMESIYSYAYLFAGFGLNNAVFRYLVLKDADAERKGIFNYIVSRGMAFNAIFVIVVATVVFLLPQPDQFSVAHYLLPLMLLALPMQYIFDTCSFSLRALFRNRDYALAAVAAVVTIWVTKAVGASLFGLEGASVSWPVAYLAIASVSVLYFRKSVFPIKTSIEPDRVERRAIRSYSLQYMITNGMWVMFLQNDLLMISLLTGDAAAIADYKVAYTIPAAIAILSTSIGIFVAPYFVKNERDEAWVWSNFKKVMTASIALVGTATLLVGLLATPIITVFYGEQYLNVVPLMNALLVTAFITNGIRYTTANLLAAMGRIKVNMAISFAGIIAQIALNFHLIPIFGVYGAAFTSIIVYSLMAFAVFISFVTIDRAK